MTHSDFMLAVNKYYAKDNRSVFQNSVVESVFFRKVNMIPEHKLATTLDALFELTPASWVPDCKSLSDAIEKEKKTAQDALLNTPDIKCPICGHVRQSNVFACPECAYDPESDGTPSEYREWWIEHKNGSRSEIVSIFSEILNRRVMHEK